VSTKPGLVLYVGFSLGILGVILAAESAEVSKAGVNVMLVTFVVWLFGLVMVLASHFAEPGPA